MNANKIYLWYTTLKPQALVHVKKTHSRVSPCTGTLLNATARNSPAVDGLSVIIFSALNLSCD